MFNLRDRYRKSREMLDVVERIIPLASQTFSKSHIQFPEASPHFIVNGKGSHVWDVDGNEYIDFINGLLPVILGYCDPDVDAAVSDQLRRGVSFSLPSPLEGELAEILVDIIPCAEMVRFGKNGSDATAGAIRIARAYTGRERIAVCGYHGWQDWYIGCTTRDKGIPLAVKELTHQFTYNDLSSLEALFDKHPGEFAAVIMEPMNTDDPIPAFLEGVQETAHKNGAVFILDEIITGFRYSLGGAQELFGITPDMATFGKSMANGFPISVVAGKKEFMEEMEDIFFSFTFGGEAVSIAAAIATIAKIRRESVIDNLWNKGQIIIDEVTRLIKSHELEQVIQIKGKAPWSLLMINNYNTTTSWEIKSLFMQAMLARGILISGSHNISYAHSEDDLNRLFSVYNEVFSLVHNALKNDSTKIALAGNPIEPLFKIR
ncbi:MAG: aminotransferase class III-fold pyridoxal phosphate-dependent enzyme [Thermodesulfobacteriota bacterium]|nr:aminotransferase class III-fold pyridoxal phosphate-dependent enzyme [Thermodesulfobacteriota bacterium]